MPGPLCEPARPGGDPGLSGCVKMPFPGSKGQSVIPAPLRHSRETGRVKTLTSGHERPLRHSLASPSFPRKRESRGPGGVPTRRFPTPPRRDSRFRGNDDSGAVAPLGWGFDTAWKARIQGWWRGLQRRFPTPPRLDSRFRGNDDSGAVAPLGWGFDTAWKAGIQGWWSGLQRRFPTPPRLDSRFRRNDDSGGRCFSRMAF